MMNVTPNDGVDADAHEPLVSKSFDTAACHPHFGVLDEEHQKDNQELPSEPGVISVTILVVSPHTVTVRASHGMLG